MTQTQSKSTQLGPLVLTSLLGLSLCFPSAFVLADETPSVRRTTTVRAIQTAEPAVVNIEGNKPSNPALADSQQVNGMGAGVIIDARGYILTNQHVVQDVGRIEITLHDGTRHIGRLIARDADTDLALVKISSKTPLPVIRCGTSSDLMRGERVIAIGNPFGYHNTVTEGIVSALHRDIPVNGTQNYPDLIQTDASINPGNSGGPLLNADGEMIGINAAVRIGAQGIGFAIPVDKAIEIAADMIAQHRRGSFESSVSVSTRYSEGAAYVEVVRASGSELQRGDVLKQIANRPIHTRLDYEFALLDQSAGADVEVDVERSGTLFTRRLAIDSQVSSSVSNAAANTSATRAQLASTTSIQDQVYRIIGLRLEVADAARVRENDSSYKGGLQVTAVRHGSAAYNAQIQTGDVLVGMLEWQTPNWDDLAWIMKADEFRANSSPKFHIMRGKEVFWGTMSINHTAVR
ncbi:MAG: trypsin-like peptidase domain-containing protein [Pirellulaceae bacterium]|nr:trypsin-like peptidase domain-containing protein [Pirellulaceae bacterium]